MKALVRDIELARAKDVRATDKHLIVDLVDGRTITVPLEWYPRLMNGTPKERRNWGFHASGEGIYWPDLDEDLSVEGLLAGRPSGESQKSFQRWLKGRKAQRKTRGRKA
jgi:hypothetical protein